MNPKPTPEVSNCCKAPIEVSTADEGTSCYICTKCGKPCDIAIDPTPEAEKNDAVYVKDKFTTGCFCKNVEIQKYQNTVGMIPFWRDKVVCIDSCLASEIAWLWKHGVVTTGSCCGHGKVSPMINVIDLAIEKMEELGYKHDTHGNDEQNAFTFIPKSIDE